MTRKRWDMQSQINRRDMIKFSTSASSALALGGLGGSASLFSNSALGGPGDTKSAVVVVYLMGGYNALFASPASFLNTSFCVTGTNTFQVGTGSNTLLLDRSFESLNPFVKSHIASVGINHGINTHPQAQTAQFTVQNANPLLTLAKGLGGSASIKCANLGSALIPNAASRAAGESIQTIADMQSLVDALGGGKPDLTMPDREIAAAAVKASQEMSKTTLDANQGSLASAITSYPVAIDTLSKPAQSFNPAELQSAYSLSGTAVKSFPSQMAAAELSIRAGANVVAAVSGPLSPNVWDSHGDTNGTKVRDLFRKEILPGLKTFTDRMMVEQGPFSVTLIILGDFARSLPGSDHATVSVATVISPRVKVGTTGQVNAQVRLVNAPQIPAFWGFIADTVNAPQETVQALGGNGHPSLILKS